MKILNIGGGILGEGVQGSEYWGGAEGGGQTFSQAVNWLEPPPPISAK